MSEKQHLEAARRKLCEDSRLALKTYLAEFNWTHFFTVTFRKPQRYGITAVGNVTHYLDESGYFNKAFISGEQHESGFWHIHGIGESKPSIFNSPGRLQGIDTAYFESHLTTRFGWSRFEPISNIGGTIGYCSKYISKDSPTEWDFLWDS